MIKTIIYIGVGGAIGSVLRYLIAIFINKYWSSSFPFATFIINILGCFLIGFFIGFLEKHNLTDVNLKSFLIIGFCGGFTTFSAFSQENLSLFQNQNIISGSIYLCLSAFLGISSKFVSSG